MLYGRLLSGHPQIVLAHAERQVAGHCHCNALADARPHDLRARGATQIAEQLVGRGSLTGGRPGPPQRSKAILNS